jgi:nucleoside-diphosphate-sugar epimerase
MRRLLLTGITGKSGSVLTEELQKNGEAEEWTIRAAVRPASDITQLASCLPETEIYLGDLTDSAYLQKLTQGVDVLFHIAGIYLSLPLVESAVKNGVKRMVLVHTTGIYSKYKAAGEEYRRIEARIGELAKQYQVRITYLRPTMIYGTLQDQNIAKFIKMVDTFSLMPVVNRATYFLQPVHYVDLGRAYAQVLRNLEKTAGKSYILSGRDPIMLIEIFRLIERNLGVKRRYLSVPLSVAYVGAWGVYIISLTKVDFREKVQRLCENRNFDHEDAARDFQYNPMSFTNGLRQEVAAYQTAKRGINYSEEGRRE